MKFIRRIFLFAGVLMLVLLARIDTRDIVKAKTVDSAYDFYWKYGNLSVFQPTSLTNGNIYCAVRGNLSDSSIKYKTIGWKMTVYMDGDTPKKLQTVYFKLGGDYIKKKKTEIVDNDEYCLYAVSLSNFKKRLNSKSKDAIKKGKCLIFLDSCMVVTKDGIPGGTIDDDGNTTGTVYSRYEDILAAENWSEDARKALDYYFGKTIGNLFYKVTIGVGSGVDSVSGHGKYMYGTKATLTAHAKKGYKMLGWDNGEIVKSAKHTFRVTEDVCWYTVTEPLSVKVNYHRNKKKGDKEKASEILYYDDPNQSMRVCTWKRSGYHFGGWGETQDTELPLRIKDNKVTNDFVMEFAPEVDLYVIWKMNSYTVHYDSIGSREVPDVSVSYSGELKAADYGTVKGWSLSPSSRQVDIRMGEKVSVASLVKALNLQHTDDATITLYAVMEAGPSIAAEDLYYSLAFARAGGITEDEIFLHAQATDPADGQLEHGENEGKLFKLTAFDADTFTKMTEEGDVALSFIAQNSMGNIAEKDIVVHVIDTTTQSPSKNRENIRFVSAKYLFDSDGNFRNQKAGGLLERSCWKKAEYINLLKFALEV